MKPIRALAKARIVITCRTVAAVRHESSLKIGVIAAGVILLWVGALALAHTAFAAVDRLGAQLLGVPEVSVVEILLPSLLGVMALVLLLMLIFSSAILAFGTLYQHEEMDLLAVQPVPWSTLFLAKFTEIVVLASWASVFLGSPILIAFTLVTDGRWLLLVAAMVLFIPFAAVASAVGCLLAMAAARALPHAPRLAVVGVGAIVAALFGLTFYHRLSGPAIGEDIDLQGLLTLANQANNPFLPSTWFVDGVLASGYGRWRAVARSVVLLTVNSAFFVWLASVAADRILPAGRSAVASRSPLASARRRGSKGILERVLAPLPNPFRWLVIKDVREFLRNPAQWSQFAVFFGVLALYMATMRPSAHGFDDPLWRDWIALLNIIASLLVLATMTTRFVFPLISLEGRTIWILALSPLPMRRLVFEKFYLSSAFTLLITGSLAVLSGWRLGLDFVPFAASLAGVVAASLALSALAVGLGSIYPSFDEKSPSRIVSGLGGTLTFLLSIAYVVVVAGAEAVVIHAHRLKAAFGPSPTLILGILAVAATATAVTVTAIWLPLRLAVRSLDHIEL